MTFGFVTIGTLAAATLNAADSKTALLRSGNADAVRVIEAQAAVLQEAQAALAVWIARYRRRWTERAVGGLQYAEVLTAGRSLVGR